MSPTANTSGCPGRRAVGLHRDPARPVDLGAGLARRASSPAATPARPPPRSGCGLRIVSTPSGPLTVMRLVVHVDGQGVERGSRRPSSPACCWVYCRSFSANGGSTAGAPSSRRIRGLAGVDGRGSRAAAPCARARRSARPARRRSGRRRSRRTSATPRARPGRSPARPSRTPAGCGRAGAGRPRWSSCRARTRRTRRGRSRSAWRPPRRPACRRAASSGRPSGRLARDHLAFRGRGR